MNKRTIRILSYVVLILSISACQQEQSNQTEEPTSEKKDEKQKDNSITNENLDEEKTSLTLEEIAIEICDLLKEEEFLKIEKHINSDNQILFSPYLYIDEKNSQTLTLSEWKKLYDSEEKQNWGIWDGVGGDVELTAKEYYNRFIMRGDYCEGGELSIDSLFEKGSALNNISDVFPASSFVSFFIPPDDADLAQMSWKTLIFVFNEEKKLVAIVNHEWTT